MGIDKYVYAAGDATYTAFISRVEKQSKGYNGTSLTNYDATAVCQIAEGSVFEIAGSVYLATADTSITGSVATGVCYIYATGATATASIAWDTSNAPVWRDDYQGYYQSAASAIRAIGGCYFDGSAYQEKWIYRHQSDMRYTRASGSLRPLKTKVVEIGDWNMTDHFSEAVTHGLGDDHLAIRSISVTIRDDNGQCYDLYLWNAGTLEGGIGGTTSTATTIYVLENGGTFDSAGFDSTSYNRGWIHYEYEDAIY